MTIRVARYAPILALTVIALSCGDPPNNPGPIINPPPPPVNNTAPVITSITVQGTRGNEPANFADVSETVPVTAAVTDVESNVELLQYNWTATLGTFTGTGARVSWVAPSTVGEPTLVTITLEVVERFGTNQENKVSRTATVALHDSIKEVGDMARQFLLNFSDTNIKDASVIMRDFGTAAICPEPNEIVSERSDVINHYTNYRMIESTVGNAAVTVNFGGSCPYRFKRGDACAVVPVMWNSVDLRTNVRDRHSGNDIVAAAFSRADNRWFLCASDYNRLSSFSLVPYPR